MSTLRAGQEKQLRAAGVELIPYRAVVTGPHTVEAGARPTRRPTSWSPRAPSPPCPHPRPGHTRCSHQRRPAVRSASPGPSGHHRRRSDRGGAGVCLGRRRLPRHHSGGGPRLLPTLERELGQSLAAQLRQDGVEVFTGAGVTGATPGPAVAFTHRGGVPAGGRRRSGGHRAAARHRRPLCRGPPAGAGAGVPPGGRTVPHLHPSPLRHRGRHRRGHAGPQGGGGGALCGRPPAGPHPLRGVAPIPACVYTSPELAQVGLTADEARARGIPCAAGKCVLGGNARTPHRGGSGLCQAGISPGEPRPLLGLSCAVTGPPIRSPSSPWRSRWS